MILIIAFLTGIFLNDSRLMYKVFSIQLEFIKYRLILKELGVFGLSFCLIINYLKGFLIIYYFNQGEKSTLILALLLLCGNHLGARPIRTGGSELIILLGILGGFNYSIIQIPIAIFIGGILLTRRINKSFCVASIFCLGILFIYKYYYLFLLSFLIFMNYMKEGQSHFLSFINKIKRKISIVEIKG